MPSDKFVKNDQDNVFLVQGFSFGTADSDQDGQHAIVMALICAGKPGIMIILPESSYLDFVTMMGEAKEKIEDKRRRETARNPGPFNVLDGGKDGAK